MASGALSLYTKTEGSELTRIWSNAGENAFFTNDWTLAVVSDASQLMSYQLVLEIKVLKLNGNVSAAIDDISVDSKACQPFGESI